MRSCVVSLVAAITLGVAGLILLPRWHGAPRPQRKDLRDDSPAVRVWALRELGRGLGADELIAALNDEDADVRLVAAQQRGASVSEIGRWAEALVGALGDPHAGVRSEAADTLCWIGERAVPALCGAMSHPNPRVRAGAASVLGADPPKSTRDRSRGELDRVVPLLLKALEDENPEVRRNAAQTLERLWDFD